MECWSADEWRAEAILFFAFEKAEQPLSGFNDWITDQAPWLYSLLETEISRENQPGGCLLRSDSRTEYPQSPLRGARDREQFEMQKLAPPRPRHSGNARPAAQVTRDSMAAFEGLPLQPDSALFESLTGRSRALQVRRIEDARRGSPDLPADLLILDRKDPRKRFDRRPRRRKRPFPGSISPGPVTTPANEATPAFIAEAGAVLPRSTISKSRSSISKRPAGWGWSVQRRSTREQ